MNPPATLFGLSLLCLLLTGSLRSETPRLFEDGVLRDPRGIYRLNETIRNGKPVEGASVTHAIFLIDWRPAPDRQNGVYQISGIEGYYETRHIEAFLREFYRLSAERRAASASRLPLENIVTATNNWGGFSIATELLEELSAQYGFSVFAAGGWVFHRAELCIEPAERLELIREAFRLATLGEDRPALNPQRRILSATERLPRAMDPRILEPVPSATRLQGPELGNVWYSRPYSHNGQWLGWSMGWRSAMRAKDPEIGVNLWFSTGFTESGTDPFSDPPESDPPEPVQVPKGELDSITFNDSWKIDRGFHPEYFRETIDLDLTVSRKHGESEDELILRSARELAEHTPDEAADCVRAYEKILRTLLALIRE